MAYFVRKIARSKWSRSQPDDIDVRADAITSCLRTTRDTLSLWKISSEEEINHAALAIISSQDKFETIDLIILEQQKLEALNLKIVHSPQDGMTPIESLKETHFDLIELTYSKLGILKDYIITKVDGGKIIRFTRTKTIDIIKEAIKNKVLDPSILKDSLRNEIN